MTPASLIRLSGAALLGGALVGTSIVAVHPESPRDPLNGPLHTVYVPALMFILLGLTGVIAQQLRRAGMIGLVSALVLWVGLVVGELPHALIDATIVPALLADPSTEGLVSEQSVLYANLTHGPFALTMLVGTPLVLLGMLMLPLASLRAGVLPRWPSVLLLSGFALSVANMVMPAIPGATGGVLAFLGLAGYGLALALDLGPERLRWRLRVASGGTLVAP